MLNRIILIGRLTKDPELRYTNSGTAVCGFTLAVDSGFGDNKRTDFIDIVVWGKAGESCSQYLAKGKLAAVEGRLQIRNYEDKNGGKRRATEVVAENVRFLSPRSESAGSSPAADDYTAGEWTGSPDEDLPF